ncbi:aspartate carbamoyltransferase [Tichowtungia aerotolerans]|uniref:Aspartate carbamoyltransferase n=1 Tax=Tichowtungia aerotolerans TaxID=2697043 RepID=A0A6P1M948_9BACT|nr:aspartate carbamoyltransferase [Tichowtungia aerotolerans]QHI70417.1 aspartate carbamoyltransferase [Tichowtungia aerotolerans]
MSEHQLNQISWNKLNGLGPEGKSPYFQQDGRTFHALVAQQFSRPMLEDLCSLATCVRKIAKSREGCSFLQSRLFDKRAMLYFAQPSTRTYLSFDSACQTVGLDCMDVRDSSTSSEVKGESPEDTVRTFSSYTDLIIMRHPAGGFAERIAWMLSNTSRPVPVINAGSGKDQHPTQALLDIYTLERSFEKIGGIDEKKVAFVGDLKRGRTVRSLAWLLTQYENVKMYFVAPQELQIGEDVLAQLDAVGVPYEICYEFETIIPEVDAIYMTRIQDEWDIDNESSLIDTSEFYFTKEYLNILKKDAVIMHPLPRRKEIDVAVDSDPRAVYWRQVRNGMWIRSALILSIFGLDGRVRDYYKEEIS